MAFRQALLLALAGFSLAGTAAADSFHTDQQGRRCISMTGQNAESSDAAGFHQVNHVISFENRCNGIIVVVAERRNGGSSSGGVAGGSTITLNCVDNKFQQCGGFSSWYER